MNKGNVYSCKTPDGDATKNNFHLFSPLDFWHTWCELLWIQAHFFHQITLLGGKNSNKVFVLMHKKTLIVNMFQVTCLLLFIVWLLFLLRFLLLFPVLLQCGLCLWSCFVYSLCFLQSKQKQMMFGKQWVWTFWRLLIATWNSEHLFFSVNFYVECCWSLLNLWARISLWFFFLKEFISRRTLN